MCDDQSARTSPALRRESQWRGRNRPLGPQLQQARLKRPSNTWTFLLAQQLYAATHVLEALGGDPALSSHPAVENHPLRAKKVETAVACEMRELGGV